MDLLEQAKQIALDAGALIQTYASESLQTNLKSSEFDIVTEADKATENFIRERIRDLDASHSFLGEEESFAGKDRLKERLEQAGSEPFLWIVDPIDGTSNFVQGLPHYCVSIGLACQGELRLGVIYNPVLNELYWAEKGKGAFLNGTKITVSDVDRLNQSAVGSGFTSNKENRPISLKSMEQASLYCRTIRSMGSAAMNMAYVASGKLTAYWQYGLNAWDVAAGVLIVKEAGGNVTDTEGDSYVLSTKDMLCSNGKVHDLLLPCLRR